MPIHSKSVVFDESVFILEGVLFILQSNIK